MKHTVKKIVALLMVLAMIFQMTPVSVLAEGTEPVENAGQATDALGKEKAPAEAESVISTPMQLFKSSDELAQERIDLTKEQITIVQKEFGKEDVEKLNAMLPKLRGADPKGAPKAPSEGECHVEAYLAFDIKLNDGVGAAEVYQVPVTLETAVDMLAEYRKLAIDPESIKTSYSLYHMHEGKAEEIGKLQVDAKDGILSGFTFETENFSDFVLKYTVDFHYNGKDYSIPGNSQILLSELIAQLQIKNGNALLNVADVEKVEFTDEHLVTVEKVSGMITYNEEENVDAGEKDFLLTSEAPFTSDEKLTITLTDGSTIEVGVTDDTGDPIVTINNQTGAEITGLDKYYVFTKVEYNGQKYYKYLRINELNVDSNIYSEGNLWPYLNGQPGGENAYGGNAQDITCGIVYSQYSDPNTDNIFGTDENNSRNRVEGTQTRIFGEYQFSANGNTITVNNLPEYSFKLIVDGAEGDTSLDSDYYPYVKLTRNNQAYYAVSESPIGSIPQAGSTFTFDKFYNPDNPQIFVGYESGDDIELGLCADSHPNAYHEVPNKVIGSMIGDYLLESYEDDPSGIPGIKLRKLPPKTVEINFFLDENKTVPDTNPGLTGYYILIDQNSTIKAYAPLTIEGSKGVAGPFIGSDGGEYTDWPATGLGIQIAKYNGEDDVNFSTFAGYNPSVEKPNNGELGKYIYDLTNTTPNADNVFVETAVKKDQLTVTVQTYDKSGTQVYTPNAEDGTEIPGTYYVRAKLTYKEGNTVGGTAGGDAGWCMQQFSYASGSSTTEVALEKFVSMTSNPFENNGIVSYNSTDYELDVNSVRVVSLKNQNQKPNNYSEAENPTTNPNTKINDSAPDGYAWVKGNNPSATADGALVKLKLADDIDYFVRLKFDTAFADDISLLDHVFVKVTLGHKGGYSTYGFVEATKDHISTENGYTYIDVPITQWMILNNESQTYSVAPNEKFTGDETSTTVELVGGATAGNPNSGKVLQIGEYVNAFEVTDYPDTQEEPERIKKPSTKPDTIEVYDVITLEKNTDNFGLYSLESILNGGYNVVTLCDGTNGDTNFSSNVGQGDASISCHQMGGLLIRGDLDFNLGSDNGGFADSPDADHPSVVGGYISGMNHTGNIVNCRANNSDNVPFYVGSSNKVVGSSVNGTVYGNAYDGVWHGFNYAGATIVNDNFVNWDRLQTNLRNASQSLAGNATRHVSAENGVLEGENVLLVTLSAGDNVIIDGADGQEIYINIVADTDNELGTWVNGKFKPKDNLPGTVINFTGIGDMIVPHLRLNGHKLETDETGKGISIVYNYPNCEGTITKTGDPEFGHVVAPKAFVHYGTGNYSGTVVCNNARIEAGGEGHLYPYKGGTLVGVNAEIKFGKTVNGETPTQNYKFVIEEYKEDTDQWKCVDTVQNNGGTISFKDISFYVGGTYYFRIYEDDANVAANVTCDSSKYLMKVVVVADVSGSKTVLSVDHSASKLYKIKDETVALFTGSGTDLEPNSAAVEEVSGMGWETNIYDNIETCTTGQTFINTIEQVDTYIQLFGSKSYEDGELTDHQFAFQVLDNENNVVVTGYNNSRGQITFPKIKYKYADFSELNEDITTLIYTVKEVIPEGATEANNYTVDGVKYDNNTLYTVTVTITRDTENQTLSSEYTIFPDNTISFINESVDMDVGSIKVTKTVKYNGNVDTEADNLTFSVGISTTQNPTTIAAADIKTITVTDGVGEVTFNDLTVGETYYIYEVDEDGKPVGEGYAYAVEGSGTSKTIERGTLNYEVDLTNSKSESGDLELSKDLISDRAADKNYEFSFTVKLSDTMINGTYGDMKFTAGEANVKLKGGNSATAIGLPCRITYTIKEEDTDGFELTKKTGNTGTISTTKSTAVFTNTRKTGDLKISKEVVSDAAADAEQEFTFAIKLSDETISGTYGDLTFEKGVATVELKGGESATATGLPTGIDYTVTEAVDENFEVTKTGDTGTIDEAGCEASFTNTRKTGDLEISKTVVSSIAADADQKFTFTIELSDKTISGTYGDMTFEKGIATIELKGGESATAEGLPTGIDYQVTEATNETFNTEKTGDTGTIVEAGCTAVFTNTRKTANVKVSKVDIASGEELEGATIQILRKVTEEDAADESTRYADEEKTLVIVDEWISETQPHVSEDLLTNTEYTLRETVAPDGYTVTVDTSFTIDKNGKVTSTGTVNKDGVLLVEDSITHIKVSKVDAANGEELEGATIQILRKATEADTANEKTEYADEARTMVIVDEWVSSDAVHEIEGLKTNTEYTLRETVAPDGYTITTDNTFTIDETGKVTSTGSVSEDGVLLVEDSKTRVKVSKVDAASGEELEGATIQILRKATDADAANDKTKYADEAKTLVIEDEWVSSDEVHVIEGLKTNIEYTLRETVAPDGYTITTDNTFTIDETGKVTSTGAVSEDGVLLVEDSMTRIRVSKADAASGEELEGATIQILRKATEEDAANDKTKYADEARTLVIVEEWISEIEPHITEGLLTGTEYILRETVAPHGYDLTTDNMFIIDETGKVTSTGSISEDGMLLVEDDMLTVCAAVKKAWDDEENRDGRRPLKVTVDLLANGTVIRTVDLTEENHWMAVASGLPMVDKALKTIEYTWTEHEPGNGYKLTGNVKKGTLTILTNSRDVEQTEVYVEKKWEDNGNASGKRPDKIRVQLYANGEACEDEVILNAGNGWKHTWTGLKKNCDQAEIAYTVEELEVPEGYRVTKSGNAASGFVLTNTLERGSLVIKKTFDIEEPEPEEEPETELIDINVKKVWIDNNDQDGVRPESVTVHLLAGGEIIDTVQLKETTGWKYAFRDLPKTVRGNRISYSVTEDPVPGYTCEVNGYTIRNTHKPEETSVSVRKVWNDRNNAQGIRPTSIRMTLSNGTNVLLSEANGWQATITGLPKRVNGEEINYTWVEQEVVGYRQESVTVQGSVTTFTNTPADIPNVPEGMKKPKLPGGEWAIFEEYQTALGVETIINHVGDCFD